MPARVPGLGRIFGHYGIHAIVQVEGDVSDAELLAHLSEHVARYKLPRSFERTDEPLRDDAGKVRRGALRESRLGRG